MFIDTQLIDTQLIDTHCHLDPKAYGGWDEIDAVIQRAHDLGVGTMISIGSGYGVDSAARVMELIERHNTVYGTIGIHPHDASTWSSTVEQQLYDWARHPKILAIGEMGLDFFYTKSTPKAQRQAFISQIELARALDLPIIIHDRDSEGEVFEILKANSAFDVGVLYHCFCGTVDEMRHITEMGGYISIPGIVTFKNGHQMRDVVKAAPLERLLIETDAPFLTPVPHRGKRNEPQYVRFVAEQMASLKSCSFDEIAKATTLNARRFFSILS